MLIINKPRIITYKKMTVEVMTQNKDTWEITKHIFNDVYVNSENEIIDTVKTQFSERTKIKVSNILSCEEITFKFNTLDVVKVEK